MYRDERKSGRISFEFELKSDMPTVLKFSSGNISGEITGVVPEAARNRSLTEDDVKKQLSKLGGTRYELDALSCNIDDGLTIPASELNRLRREAVSECDRLTVLQNTPIYHINDFAPEKPVPSRKASDMHLRVMTKNAETLKAVYEYSELVIAPAHICRELDAELYAQKTAVSLPDIVSDEGRLLNELKELYNVGFRHFVCGNFTHFGVLSQLDGIKIHGGTGLNITNSYAAKRFAQLGLCDITASFELKAAQISALEKPIPTGFYAYGRLPLMITKNCPVRAQAGCKSCTGSITDRTGRKFPVECAGKQYARILNCDILETSDKLSDFKGAAFALLDMGNMPPKPASDVIKRYMDRGTPEGKFTRGLYYRGII